jgi:hypothetical protein
VAVSLAIVVVAWPGLARGSARRVRSSCSRAQLSAYSYFAGGGLGHASEVIVLVDRGGVCVLRGYLRVRLLDGGHSPIGTLVKRSVIGFLTGGRRPVRTVRLSQGKEASFEIDYGEEPGVLGPGNRSCERISWLGAQLVGGRLDVPTRISPCGGAFLESPVQPGLLAPARHG